MQLPLLKPQKGNKDIIKVIPVTPFNPNFMKRRKCFVCALSEKLSQAIFGRKAVIKAPSLNLSH